MEKKIGVFGGSFDPVHLGHLNLALQIQESLSLEKVLWVPAFCSPTRIKCPPIADSFHRLQMVQSAIHPIESFSCLDFETQQKKPSYTINTIRFLQEKVYPEASLFLLLSEEAYEGFSKWKEAEELGRRVTLVCGKRKCSSKNLVLDFPLLRVENRVLEISSTQIRKRIKENQYVGHLVPEGVLAYIKKHHLYKRNHEVVKSSSSDCL